MMFLKSKYIAGFFLLTVFFVSSCGQRPDDPVEVVVDEDGAVSEVTDGAIVFGPNGEVLNGGDPELGAALASALTVHVISDVNSLPTGGSDFANIQVLVTDEGNRAANSADIEFSATAGVLQEIGMATDGNGETTALLNLGRDYTNQDIVVTAVSGGSMGSVVITARGSTVEISGQDTLIAGDVANLSATLVAGNGEPIANQEINFISMAGNSITTPRTTTDANGQISLQVDSSLGSDVITATALDGTAVTTFSLTVASDILEFISPSANAEIVVGVISTLAVRWESEGASVAGEDLRFSLTAGQIIGNPVVTTDADGEASVQFISNSAGPATVSVAAVQGESLETQRQFEFVATTPSELRLSASATRVPAGETSRLTALVVDANGNPVKNAEVIFSSPDLRGGQINPASAMSNSDGLATVTFTAGALATEFEAIQILANIANLNFADSVSLTAVERVLNVTVGTTSLIRAINGETQYSLPFVVQVADGSGSPLEGASVELSVRPLNYGKGFFRIVDANGLLLEEHLALNPGQNFSGDRWALRSMNHTVCGAEDINGNRLLDAGEDINGNGSLDPQDPAVVASDSVNSPTLENGSITTDATGSGFFAVIYPQSNALWAEIEITARAKGLGAEAEAKFRTSLSVLAAELDDVNTSLPNQTSPYGTSVTQNPAVDCANDL